MFFVREFVDTELGQWRDMPRKNYVLTRNRIKAGEALTRANIQDKRLPEKFAPRSAITMEQIEEYLGQEIAVDVEQQDYVLASYFSERRFVGNSLSEQIPQTENFRAVSLPVDETNSLSRSIIAGDHVDIVFTFSVPRIPQKISVVLLQDVEVIVTGSYSIVEHERGGAGKEKRYSSLTLLLRMEDAVRLNYARQMGGVSVLLRNKKDGARVEPAPLMMGIIDVLSPSDRTKIEEIAKRAGTMDQPEANQLKEQLREIFEQQRKQAPGAK